MIEEIKLFEKEIDKNIKECKGLIFRGYSSTFYDPLTNRIEHKEGIRLLKRKSCRGCEKCGWVFDQMYEMIDCECLIFPGGGIQNGKLYTIVITNISTDYKTGCADDWDFEIIEVKEKTNDTNNQNNK